ncbi:MAG: hypothetical protein AB8B81_19270 [Halioglobus sp.]
MHRRIKKVLPVILFLLPSLYSCSYVHDRNSTLEQDDITFIVAGKTANHRQHSSGSVEVLNYHFFAEIFLQENGSVDPAWIITPLANGERVAFEDSGYALEMHGGRYRSEAELEQAYPDGDYVFHYRSPSTGSVSQIVAMGNPNSGVSGIPAAPRIFLSQQGDVVDAGNINPKLDLQVTWSEFTAGGADPLGIMDDLLFVILADCDGVRRAHSGRPFENTPYLTYADKSYTIPAEKLLPENIYQLSVEHAVLDTGKEHGVIAFSTFATTTFLEIHTLGKADPGTACPRVRKKFDAGQTVL